MSLLEFRSITKSFPGIRALDDVSLSVAAGTCHGLVGENGAGKSTLGKILAGLYQPDAGQIVLDGRPVRFDGPAGAMRAGLGMVHQELALCENLSVAENLCLDHLPRRGPFVSRGATQRRARELLEPLGVTLDATQPAGSLSIGQRQIVQIAAAVGR
ncbi:MAG: ATP-binding cassette domain-containing protein, partial [Armatimonadota bacterium]